MFTFSAPAASAAPSATGHQGSAFPAADEPLFPAFDEDLDDDDIHSWLASASHTDFPGDHVVTKVEAMNARDAQAMASLSGVSQSVSDEVLGVGQLPAPTLSRSVASRNEVSGTGTQVANALAVPEDLGQVISEIGRC
ncbi:hypothetical protein FPQ18DRAFT_306442 [Pyronema domesticum]|nr:hypothetical protein FPQ18DRAFT_306442 [Pyronema domesticum]